MLKRCLTYIPVFILLTSCVNSEIKSGGSPTFLTDNSCTSPCWNGIIPGETSANDTFTILSQLPQVDQDSIRVNNPRNFHRAAIFDLVSGEEVDLIFQNDTLIFLGFFYPKSFESLEVTYQQLLDEFGEPDSVIVTKGPVGDCYYTYFHSLYIDRGIAYSFTTNPGCIIFGVIKEIESGTHINALYYFDPNYFNELIDNGIISRGFFSSEYVNGLMQPWKGYGNIEDLYLQRE